MKPGPKPYIHGCEHCANPMFFDGEVCPCVSARKFVRGLMVVAIVLLVAGAFFLGTRLCR